MLPKPTDPKLSAPGFSLAMAMSSPSDFGGVVVAHGDDERVVDQRRDHLKALGGLVGEALVGRRGNRMGASDETERVAVRRGFRDGIRRDVAAGAGLGLDDDRLPELLREAVGDDARQRVGGAAGGKSVQQPDRARRISVGRRSGGARQMPNRKMAAASRFIRCMDASPSDCSSLAAATRGVR